MKKIVLDPGHGGSDSGAVHGQYKEKDLTLQIGRAVNQDLLSRYQVEVLMTRTTDRTVSLRARTDFANRENADFFCSIHINSGGGTGWESFIFNGRVPQRTINHQKKIHDAVIKRIGDQYGVRDRGKKRANFHVLRETKMSAVLLENLFIDTKKDRDLLSNPVFINDLSQAISKGLGEALSLPNK